VPQLASGSASFASPTVSTMAVGSARALSLHDEMRRLWEDHVWWTRQVIVSFANSLPGAGPTTIRLLRNQNHIGNLFARFYGTDAGDRLTSLLRRHIKLAAAILADAKAGNQDALDQDLKAWYANANAIARFLHSLNPANWPSTRCG